MKKRRMGCQFYLGMLAGIILIPIGLIVALMLFNGTDDARQQAPPPPNTPDLVVTISRDYLEQALAENPAFVKPVLQLGKHIQGGAALTLTVGFDFPIVQVQDVQVRAQLMSSNGKLVLNTEEARLGSDARIPVPGDLIENALSSVINQELEQRLNSSSVEVYIVNVIGESESLQIQAIVPSDGE